MSRTTLVPGAKSASAIAAGVLLTMSVGTAAASTTSPTSAPPPAADLSGAQAATTVAVGQPASWREQYTAVPAVASVPAKRPAVVPTVMVTGNFSSGDAAMRASRSAKTRTSIAAMREAYTKFTMASTATRDMRGVEPSLYRGSFYRSAMESRRLCIVERESEGHYDVVNSSGAYRGAYQVSASLARGATWMMLKEHKTLMGEANAKRVLAQLRKTPFNAWPRYWQDAMFSTVANWEGTGSGIRHWAGGRWHC